MDFLLPAGYALLIWWFTTGAILFLDGRPRATFGRSMAVATVFLAAAGFGLRLSAWDVSVRGAYQAFTCAVLVWGWLEMSFLMGFITGPRKHACFEACGGWRHFVHAAEAIIYNEMATLMAGALVVVATATGSNRFGLWTFLVLWAMRLSAKLNLFFGVPNTGEQFLPDHLRYLRGFFKKRRMNYLFPFSIVGATTVAVLLVQKCLAAQDSFSAVGYALVASLLCLAVLEHWFMVLPIRIERLWAWGMRKHAAPAAAKAPS